jgi:negative regulator of sigma E activity
MQAGVLEVIDRGLGQVGGQRVRLVEGILPRDPKAGYYSYRVLLAFDEENHLPIRILVYDWNDQIIEEYTHLQLDLNPGLTERDFDPNNREYGFSSWRITIPG